MPNPVVDPADPNRCQGVTGNGQCPNRATKGLQKCSLHGGKSTELAEAKTLYDLTEVRERQRLAQLNDSYEHDPVESLKMLLAVTRLLIEKRRNLVSNDDEFNESILPVNALYLVVERVRRSALTIETNLGALMGKPTMLQLGRLVNQVVIEELEGIENYETIVQQITADIFGCITTANNERVARPSKSPPAKTTRRKSKKLFLIDNAADAARIAQLSEHEAAKSLTEEINMAVMDIERRMNMVRTSMDLIQATPMLTKQFRVLEKLVRSAHNVEQTVGNLLTPETQQKVIVEIITIIEDGLENTKDFETITERVITRLADTLSNKEAAKDRLIGLVELENLDNGEE